MAYPAANLTTSPTNAHKATVYYQRRALDTLRQMNRFVDLCEPDDVPMRSGLTAQWYRYNVLPANTSPHAEGTTGVGLTLSSSVVTGTLSEFADFTSMSSLRKETAISNEKDHAVEELSYRASISVDTLTRAEFDSNTAASTAMIGSTFGASDVRAAVANLKAGNVRPRSDGAFAGVIHPLITYDLQADNTAGGFIDLLRYAQPGNMLSGEIGKIANCRIVETTNVATSGTAPNVLYSSYIAGSGGVGAVSLAGRGPSKVTDPTKQQFAINWVPGGPDGNDPEGMIGGYASYRFVYTAVTLDTTTLRFVYVPSNASLI